MDFQNVNSLNVKLNLLSGNLLPISNDSPFPFFWKIYSAFTWLLQIILGIVLILGCISNVSLEKIISDTIITFVVLIEVLFMIMRIYIHKDLIYLLIQKLNQILYTADETMKNIVTVTLEPIKVPLNIYWVTGAMSTFTWSCMPLLLIFERNQFYYEDYRAPVVFSKQSFSLSIFLLGSLFLTISMTNMFLKKASVDVYMMHLVLMITAQYRYFALKIAIIFQEENKGDDFQEKYRLNRKKEEEIKVLCRHHNDMIYISSLLKQLLSLNFSLFYLTSIFRFCFIGIMASNIAAVTTFWEAISIVMYTTGAIMQLYITCSCVQQLLDASTEVTDKAFHEKWYLLQPSTKCIFMLIIMANSLECKIAAFENFNLSLSSFMKILNQSYSIALLFLRMN
ncbi:odorant receptor 49a [Monomorium pharaonis]|uniref:odorant receptor 49a n=2 Tax=Monomorium pharaonis TaxID=307658 RepID=UPI00063F1A5C|nr:odorant receptor 49a [Monomorium pharaonis]